MGPIGHATVFDSSSTILQLAHKLKLDPIPITVFTHGLTVAQALLGLTYVKVILLGGDFRHENASIVGPEAQGMLERLRFDRLFLGVGAVTHDGSVYGIDMDEASLNAAMIRRSAERYLPADSSKFGRVATYAVTPLGPDIHVISDSRLAPEWQDRLKLWGAAFTLSQASLNRPPKTPRREASASSVEGPSVGMIASPLSDRSTENLLAGRELDLSHETVRR